jgi:hypothetical protein
MKTVSADGKETTTQSTFQLNGNDYPSMGNPDFDSLSGMQIDTSTAEFTLKRAGKPIGKMHRAVSKDGQTLTINFLLTNAYTVTAPFGADLVSPGHSSRLAAGCEQCLLAAGKRGGVSRRCNQKLDGRLGNRGRDPKFRTPVMQQFPARQTSMSVAIE